MKVDEGPLQTTQFPCFSIQNSPSPTICDGSLPKWALAIIHFEN